MKNNYSSIYTASEKKLFKKLNSPAKIQDYLNTLSFNFEEEGDTCFSPRMVIKVGKAHCMEGALFAAAVLEFHGEKPVILDLRSSFKPFDFDHIIAIFKKFGYYGAISKTNHAVLRYREPVYKTLRELVLSFFHEYFLDTGYKTLREYSKPLNVTHFDNISWRTSEENLFYIPEYLDASVHYSLLSKEQIKNLRKADRVEVDAGKLVEFKKNT